MNDSSPSVKRQTRVLLDLTEGPPYRPKPWSPCCAREGSRRRRRSSVPIIMLTALGRDEDIVAGLEAGADSFCTKPVSLPQLVARIGALLRRRELDAASSYRVLSAEGGDLAVDMAARQAII